ncbi:snurportin-1 isoform X1 [Octopus bimaculoides]|nr:snurportin-1 isoform X1 [Octopus bimaculoides]|eukprot:XP_014784656.1 PREDICTED: snurportin-1-like isoform X1 [Octopus bimaculoides]
MNRSSLGLFHQDPILLHLKEMEQLAEQLAETVQVKFEPNSTDAVHPRLSQYKCRKNILDQNERRQRILQVQKQNRFDYLKNIRQLVDNCWEPNDAQEEDVSAEESMECEVFKKPGRFYQNQLMLSEWLVEVPSDFEQEWLLVVCPVGKRCLVVASKGSTSVYTKNGYLVNRFPSMFPGGNRDHGSYHEAGTILDCICNEAENVYYILDVMCWNGHPMYDTETEFRFYWLHMKYNESPEHFAKHDKSKYSFVPLPNFPCNKDDISNSLHSANFTVDGVLFYHKRTHYTFGSTPLVVWLKPYMLPEILNISVPEKMLANMPPSYSNYSQHLLNVKKEKERASQQKIVNTQKPRDSPELANKGARNRGKKKKKKKKKKQNQTADENEIEIDDDIQQTSECGMETNHLKRYRINDRDNNEGSC